MKHIDPINDKCDHSDKTKVMRYDHYQDHPDR